MLQYLFSLQESMPLTFKEAIKVNQPLLNVFLNDMRQINQEYRLMRCLLPEINIAIHIFCWLSGLYKIWHFLLNVTYSTFKLLLNEENMFIWKLYIPNAKMWNTQNDKFQYNNLLKKSLLSFFFFKFHICESNAYVAD